MRPPTTRPRPRRGPSPLGTGVRVVLRHWWLIAAMAVAAVAVAIAALFIGHVPLPAQAIAAQSSTVYYDDGSVLGVYHGTEDRVIVPLNQISTHLQQAVVAAEDRTFFTDSGFSLRGTLRALWVDIRGGSIAQGGSTITQQYVRNVFTEVGHERTIVRKIREATLAIKFERKYTKQQILADYLNTVYFGRGAYGAQAAAEAYFNTSAADLTVSEAAYLAGIIRGPEYYQPEDNLAKTGQIRDTVLSDMVSAKYLSNSQADAAKQQGLPFSNAASAAAARGAYFVEYVRRLLESRYSLSDAQVETGGLKIYTTLDPKDQAAAESAVTETLTAPDDPQVALVSMSTYGAIRAMVGGKDVTDVSAAQGFNFAYQESPGAGRQAGSSFKPFTLAAFLQAGFSIQSMYQAPESIVVTSHQCQDPKGGNWSVTNFMNESFPDLNITQATSNSVNTVYAQIIDKLGPPAVKTMAQQVGGFSNLSAVCSLTLGTSAATPLDMARAYSTFSTQGLRPDPYSITKVVAPNGKVLVSQAPHTTQVLDANIANTINQVLQTVLVNGTASGKGIGRQAAGKTGTTENLEDAWFVGYTPGQPNPGLSTAVWMGYTTDAKTGQTPPMTNVHGVQVTGGTLPATIWQRYMKAALAATPTQNFIAPTIVGNILGPTGAPCPSGQSPTQYWACGAQGSCGPVTGTATGGAPTATGTSATSTTTPAPCPSPSEVLPPDIIIPSPTPSPGASPSPGATPAKPAAPKSPGKALEAPAQPGEPSHRGGAAGGVL